MGDTEPQIYRTLRSVKRKKIFLWSNDLINSGKTKQGKFPSSGLLGGLRWPHLQFCKRLGTGHGGGGTWATWLPSHSRRRGPDLAPSHSTSSEASLTKGTALSTPMLTGLLFSLIDLSCLLAPHECWPYTLNTPDLTRKNTAHPVNLNIIIYSTTKIFSISLSPILQGYTYTKGYLLKLKFNWASCILSDNYPLPQVLLSPASRKETLTCHQDVPMTLHNQ